MRAIAGVNCCKVSGEMYARDMATRPFFFVSIPLWAIILFFPIWLMGWFFWFVGYTIYLGIVILMRSIRNHREAQAISDDGYTEQKL